MLSSTSTSSPANNSNDCKTKIDPLEFLNTCYDAITPTYDFYIRSLTRVVREKLSGGHKVGKVLEFGGGPCLWPSFLLAHYANAVQFCDYAPANLETVRSWLNHSPNRFDWSKHFKHVLHEHGTSESELSTWEDDLYKALARYPLSLCDAHDPHCPILSGPSNDYDLIFTCECIETACQTRQQYKNVICRLVRLLKPGGLLVILSTLKCTFYVLGNERFDCLSIDEQLVKETLIEANISSDQFSIDVENTSDGTDPYCDLHGVMIISAVKTN